MPINTIATATKFTGELDKVYVQKAVTGFLADNTFAAKFVGAKTVSIPDVDFIGLADYDRDGGFSRGAITVSRTPYELTMDRARSLQIDREDADETGIANLAGQILGEYVRTKVVPETDAYVLSKLYTVAAGKGHTKGYNEDTVAADLLAAINSVQDASGYDEELVAFIDSKMYGALMSTNELTRQITISDFKQGEVNLKVKSLNGVTLIPVPSGRMMSEYVFNAGAGTDAGGFTANGGAAQVHAIVMPKKAASLVKKTEKMRIWNPDSNIDADAWKFDYRIYYDVFVKKSNLDKIYAIAEG